MRLVGMRLGLALASLAAGCGTDAAPLYAPPPWPPSHTAVAFARDVGGELAAGPWVYAPESRIELALDDAADLVVLTFDDAGGHLERCGVTSGGSRARLPTPDAAYRAALQPGEALRLAPVPPPPHELRFSRCDPPPPDDPCPSLRITPLRFDGATDRDIKGMTVHRGAVYLSAVGDGPADAQLFRLEGDDLLPATLPAPIGEARRGLTYLASDGDHLWATQSSRAFRLGPTRAVETATQAPWNIDQLAAEPGGPVVAVRDEEGEGGLLDFTGTLPTLDNPTTAVVLAGPGRRFALQPDAIRTFSLGAWLVDLRFELLEGYSAFGGDTDVLAAANVLGTLLIRDESSHTWQAHPPLATHVFKLRVVVPVGPGRVVVGGNEGFIALWDNDRWCPPPDRTVLNAIDAGVAYEGAVILVASQLPGVAGDHPRVLRVELIP